MQSETEQRFKVLYREAFARRKLMITAFVVIALAMVAAGANWPKTYRSSTTLLVEQQNIIEPLMQGTAVQSDMVDNARNARELIYGRSLLMKVLERGGMIEGNADPAEVEAKIAAIQASTSIMNVGQNLIKVEYQGGDPEQVYEITSLMAELFIEEMLASRVKESNVAYDFIDQQVKKYEGELVRVEERLQELRKAHDEARPGAAEENGRRISDLQSELDGIEQSLREAQIRESSLREQLSGEVETGAVASQSQRYRARISELQQQLDTLRLTYHDNYPDIVVLKEQIAELKRELAAEEQRVAQRRAGGGAENSSAADADLRSNPVYQELQSTLYDTRTEIQTLQARRSATQQKLDQALVRAQRIQEVDARFQKLMRDYEVNQAIYQDLLRRRENARVSMNLNTEPQGLTLRVVEPAYLSHQPSGPRLVHFAVGGIFLGAILPLGLLFGVLAIDPRVRTANSIRGELGLPLLEVVPHMDTPREAGARRRGLVLSALAIVLTVAAVIGVLVLRMQGVL